MLMKIDNSLTEDFEMVTFFILFWLQWGEKSCDLSLESLNGWWTTQLKAKRKC